MSDDVEQIVARLTKAQRMTCPTCEGRGFWQSFPGGEEWPCLSCRVDDARVLTLILDRITPQQREFLLFGADTLADQPATPEQWDGILMCGFWVEEDDEIDLGDGEIWPGTRRWFASSRASFAGDRGDWKLSFRYNGNGLAVRTALLSKEGESADA